MNNTAIITTAQLYKVYHVGKFHYHERTDHEGKFIIFKETLIYNNGLSLFLMDRFYNHIENLVEKEKKKQTGLEAIPTGENEKKRGDPTIILQPITPNHILRVQNREIDLPEAPEEKMEIPIIPDMKKAEEDYNSIDYQIIAFNLWKSKAKELF